MQLFVDMDGVLADFDTGYFNLTGIRPNKETDNVDWKLVREAKDFYKNLPPMPDFKQLWEGISKYNPIILTGIPLTVSEAESNKREWVDINIGKSQSMIACRSSKKYTHMKHRGDILIDDWPKYKHIWTKHGGLWIDHTSAFTTLKKLDSLLK